MREIERRGDDGSHCVCLLSLDCVHVWRCDIREVSLDVSCLGIEFVGC